MNDLLKRLLSISIRSQMNKSNQMRNWAVEFVFYSTPLQSTHQKEQGNRRTVYLTYEQANHDFVKTVDDLLRDWSKIVYLYALVFNFAEHVKSSKYLYYNIFAYRNFYCLNFVRFLIKYFVSCLFRAAEFCRYG